MKLTEEELIKLRDAIHQTFEKSDELEEFLNDENLKRKLDLEINYNNLPKNDYLNKLNIYDQNAKKYRLLILENNTERIDYKTEVNSIISQTNENDQIDFKKKNQYVRVKNSIEFHQAINGDYQICHILGHGNNGIILTTNELKIEQQQLEKVLSDQNSYQCFIFNICKSEKIAKGITKYVDYAIGMNGAINDDTAIKFAEGFYLGLNNGMTDNRDMFLTGFREAVNAIAGDQNSQYKTPVLYISYKRAILNLIKQLDAEDKIEYFLNTLHPKLSQDINFIKIFQKYTYPIKEPDLNNLVAIVNEINENKNNWNLVQSAYRETLPENATVDNSELNNPRNINHIIDIFREKYPRLENKIPSILEFTKNLAGKFEKDSDGYSRIKSWVEEVSSKLDFKIDIKPKIESISTIDQKTFLSIVISPEIVTSSEEPKFRLEAEYILDENQNTQPQPFDFKQLLNIDSQADSGKGVICSQTKIPSLLEKIINQFMKKFREKILEPIIEIFLPYKFLGRNLDHEWRIKDDNDEQVPPIAIVQNYNILFSPLERITGNKSYSNFKKSWLKFKKLLESEADKQSILTRVEKIRTIDKNYKRVGKHLRDTEKIGVKLISPLPENEQQQVYFWRAVLDGGTPLAFWTRCHNKEQINLDDVEDYLAKEYLDNNFQKFIDEIWSLRQDAYNEENMEDKLGYHLGFLCDNGNRIQKSKILKSFL